jgi:hypothetical protein
VQIHLVTKQRVCPTTSDAASSRTLGPSCYHQVAAGIPAAHMASVARRTKMAAIPTLLPRHGACARSRVTGPHSAHKRSLTGTVDSQHE